MWVTLDMARLALAAAGDMPEQPFLPTDLMFNSAFVAFPKADRMAIGQCQWRPWVYQWHVKPGGVDALAVALSRNDDIGGEEFCYVTEQSCRFGATFIDGECDDLDTVGLWRVLTALWALIQQRIAVPESRHWQRQERREWERHHHLGVPTTLEIVLRRPRERHDDESPGLFIDWSHRWLVNGHWRNQWVPSAQAHRQTWIMPYVKGPAHKPLVLKERVHVWRR
jgi:hypothetical protein